MGDYLYVHKSSLELRKTLVFSGVFQEQLFKFFFFVGHFGNTTYLSLRSSELNDNKVRWEE